ncbi:DUF4035 domain-containing protein [Streptomyces sp. PRKS01-29]|nr:DUF4035 domain-containing protein [Streptomyces sabulosicollis]MBI0294508.1 DUF4035 domain-containing protein [Streptomyces sabulosicollis]
MTVRRLLAETGSRELAEWMAYERITGPLDGRRGDVQAAIIASTVANSQRSKGRALLPKDFIPKWDRPRAMTPEEMWAAAMQANASLGGTIATTPE